MLKLALEKANDLFAAIAAQETLYLPIEKSGQVEFYPYEADANVRLDALHTVKSAKDLFFPQCENLMQFKMEGKSIEIEEPKRAEEDYVVFGVRACDARSFQILDRVFLSDPVDSYYQARREHGVIVTTACSRPEETCFCNVFGIDATEPEGDVVTWIADGVLYWEAKTEKGEALTAKVASLLEESDTAAVEAQKTEVKAIMEKLPLAGLDLARFKEDELMNIFNDEAWASMSEHCLGCGTCTFVCPTCQCYDIRDYDTGHGIQRYRCWDSCMYRDFTMMAHGNNRKSQLERFRQRFMHKLVYYPNNNEGIFSCVGCGRCVSKCPIHTNIAKVIKTLGGKDHE